MTESMIIYMLVSAGIGWAARHWGLGAPSITPAVVPPLPTGIGHGQLLEFAAKLAASVVKEVLSTYSPQPSGPLAPMSPTPSGVAITK